MKRSLVILSLILSCLCAPAQDKDAEAKKSFGIDDAKDIFAKNASSRIDVIWDEALTGISSDGRFSTWLVPVKGATGKKLVIQKDLVMGPATIYVLSAIPAQGLKEGDSFSGTVQYTHVNTQKRIAWEEYKQGKIVYCKDLRYEEAEDPSISNVNLDTRLAHNPTYQGAADPFDSFSWRVIAANRPRKAEANFSEDREQKGVVKLKEAEKVHVANPFHSGNIAKALANPEQVIYYLNYRKEVENPANPNKKLVTVDATFTNNDYCEYYAKTESGSSYIVNPGRLVASTFGNMQEANSFNTGLGGKKYYKGRPLSKVDTSFVYAFPVKAGEKTLMEKDKYEKALCYAVRMKAGSDVVAMRSGVVCRFTDKKHILIYHADGTFSAYLNLGELKVAAGDKVNTGDVIASSGAVSPSICVFYLAMNKESNPVYRAITPCFRSESGDAKLKPGTEYVSKIDTDLIIKEMSKSAQKKYLKQKGL